MFDLGIQEMLVIFVVSLLLFGPKSMPEVAKNIGKAIGYFRKTYDQLKDQMHEELREDTAPFKEEFDKINRDFLNSANEFQAEHKPFVHPSGESNDKKQETELTDTQTDTVTLPGVTPAETKSETHRDEKTHPETKI